MGAAFVFVVSVGSGFDELEGEEVSASQRLYIDSRRAASSVGTDCCCIFLRGIFFGAAGEDGACSSVFFHFFPSSLSLSICALSSSRRLSFVVNGWPDMPYRVLLYSSSSDVVSDISTSGSAVDAWSVAVAVSSQTQWPGGKSILYPCIPPWIAGREEFPAAQKHRHPSMERHLNA